MSANLDAQGVTMGVEYGQHQRFIAALEAGVQPATGCTEPVSVAFAAATAARLLGAPVERITASVSPNLLKNGMGVMVPGMGAPGLQIAAAIGALAGDPAKGLEILAHVDPDSVPGAHSMVREGRVDISIAPVAYAVWAEVKADGSGHAATVRVALSHTNVVYEEVDGHVRHDAGELREVPDVHEEYLRSLSLREISDLVDAMPAEGLALMERAAELNEALAERGLADSYGLGVGRVLQVEEESPWWEVCQARTCAASDARMGGAPLPAMTNSGSGNQGIASTVPVTTLAAHLGASHEELLRALALSHATALYIHAFLPKLSAFCAVTSAGMGAAAGMARLLGLGYGGAEMAISTMCGDLVGMVCDGAAPSCTMKVAASVSAATRAVRLAQAGHRVSGNDGMVAHSVDESIRNLGVLTCGGLKQTDPVILQIMTSKNAVSGTK